MRVKSRKLYGSSSYLHLIYFTKYSSLVFYKMSLCPVMPILMLSCEISAWMGCTGIFTNRNGWQATVQNCALMSLKERRSRSHYKKKSAVNLRQAGPANGAVRMPGAKGLRGCHPRASVLRVAVLATRSAPSAGSRSSRAPAMLAHDRCPWPFLLLLLAVVAIPGQCTHTRASFIS